MAATIASVLSAIGSAVSSVGSSAGSAAGAAGSAAGAAGSAVGAIGGPTGSALGSLGSAASSAGSAAGGAGSSIAGSLISSGQAASKLAGGAGGGGGSSFGSTGSGPLDLNPFTNQIINPAAGALKALFGQPGQAAVTNAGPQSAISDALLSSSIPNASTINFPATPASGIFRPGAVSEFAQGVASPLSSPAGGRVLRSVGSLEFPSGGDTGQFLAQIALNRLLFSPPNRSRR